MQPLDRVVFGDRARSSRRVLSPAARCAAGGCRGCSVHDQDGLRRIGRRVELELDASSRLRSETRRTPCRRRLHVEQESPRQRSTLAICRNAGDRDVVQEGLVRARSGGRALASRRRRLARRVDFRAHSLADQLPHPPRQITPAFFEAFDHRPIVSQLAEDRVGMLPEHRRRRSHARRRVRQLDWRADDRAAPTVGCSTSATISRAASLRIGEHLADLPHRAARHAGGVEARRPTPRASAVFSCSASCGRSSS